jgi:hypothetical protein
MPGAFFLASRTAVEEESEPMQGDPILLEASPSRRIPLSVKVAYTAFVAFLVPWYWWFYGPANFLWFCDIALLATVVALWWESGLLASMQLVAVLLASLIWLADLVSRLATGVFLTGWTHYMFRADIPPIIRVLSLYHGWLPLLLLWAVWRLGYDHRGWVAQSLLGLVVLPACYLFTDPVRALNGVFGPSGQHPQTWVAPWLWLAFVVLFYPLGVFLPTHLLLLRLVFRSRSARDV